jgi:hypothetical protein
MLNEKKSSTDQIKEKLFATIFGFARMRGVVVTKVKRMLEFVVRRQKTFNYQYYLAKSCGLPAGWPEKKIQLLQNAAADPVSRGKVFKELFEYSTSTRQVADFLCEFTANVFPKDFVVGKNKKIFNKKVYQFVKFNRFESFTKITLVNGFKLNEFSWLAFESKDKNKHFFMNENEWILWKIMKWLFEDIFVSLCRCYFYVTEKQKEYSKIFYYRKNIWNLVMKLSIQDLLKQTLKDAAK